MRGPVVETPSQLLHGSEAFRIGGGPEEYRAVDTADGLVWGRVGNLERVWVLSRALEPTGVGATWSWGHWDQTGTSDLDSPYLITDLLG